MQIADGIHFACLLIYIKISIYREAIFSVYSVCSSVFSMSLRSLKSTHNTDTCSLIVHRICLAINLRYIVTLNPSKHINLLIVLNYISSEYSPCKITKLYLHFSKCSRKKYRIPSVNYCAHLAISV